MMDRLTDAWWWVTDHLAELRSRLGWPMVIISAVTVLLAAGGFAFAWWQSQQTTDLDAEAQQLLGESPQLPDQTEQPSRDIPAWAQIDPDAQPLTSSAVSHRLASGARATAISDEVAETLAGEFHLDLVAYVAGYDTSDLRWRGGEVDGILRDVRWDTRNGAGVALVDRDEGRWLVAGSDGRDATRPLSDDSHTMAGLDAQTSTLQVDSGGILVAGEVELDEVEATATPVLFDFSVANPWGTQGPEWYRAEIATSEMTFDEVTLTLSGQDDAVIEFRRADNHVAVPATLREAAERRARLGLDDPAEALRQIDELDGFTLETSWRTIAELTGGRAPVSPPSGR